MRSGDSADVPPGVGTFGSRSVAVGGSALVQASDQILQQAGCLAGGLLEAAASVGGLEAEVRFESELMFGSGAYAAVVEIDRETGTLTVRQLAAVDDAEGQPRNASFVEYSLLARSRCRRSLPRSCSRPRRTTPLGQRGSAKAGLSAPPRRSPTRWPMRSADLRPIRRSRPRSCGARLEETRSMS